MHTFIKKLIYYATRGIQVVPRKTGGHKVFAYYPLIESEKDLADVIGRISWYLPKASDANVFLPVADGLQNVLLENLPVPEYQRKRDSNGANLNLCCYQEIKALYAKADYLLFWKLTDLSDLLKFFPYYHRIRVVDPEFYLFTETHTYPALYWYDLIPSNTRQQWKKDSRDNLFQLFDKLQGRDKAYIFGTGPSIDYALKLKNYDDGVRIICNSMVKNNQLLDRIKPNIIVFTDSVFHFGVSKYAEEFAEDVKKVVGKFECYCITNEVGYGMMRLHYPELAPYLIAVPALRFGKPLILTPQTHKTRDYTNVLTRYMLPLGAGLAKHIVLMGFDGRNPDESYFWKHNSTTQYTNQMDSTKLAHPAFFRDISYDRYYETHCRVLQEMIETFEAEGCLIESWTSSYMPALKDRFSLITT